MPPLNLDPDLDRRAALKILAAAAAALSAGCSKPDEEIVPYVHMPEGMVAGEPMRFATTLRLAGYGRGFLATSVDGHPIKIEGNPRHPFSLGATDIFAEAEVMSLYDPDRATAVQHRGRPAAWADFAAAWEQARAGGAPALVTGRVVSRTTLARIEALRRRLPALRWYRYEPVNDDMARGGAREAFGRPFDALPRWQDADVVLLLEADPLGHGPDELRIARAYAGRRAGLEGRQRVHAAEATWSLSGAAADFRCVLQPGAIREVARLVANDLGANLGAPRLAEEGLAFARAASRALRRAPGRALVLVGESQPPEVHAAAHWINARLQAPLDYLPPHDPAARDHSDSVQALADDLHARRIGALVIAEANPVYDAPDALRMAEAISAAPFSARLGLHADETAARCEWRLPLSHPLESWGDARALNGLASLIQPLIRPLYDTKTLDEVLALLAGAGEARAHGLTRETWSADAAGDFESWWRTALHDGVIAGSEAQAVRPPEAARPRLPAADAGSPHVVLSPDASTWDGRYGNNAWLQECPKPFTRQVWGNAAQLAPGDAARLGVGDQDTVEIAFDGTAVALPVAVTPGQAEGVVAIGIGHGRTAAGRIGNGVGVRLCGFAARPFARVLTGGITLAKSAASVPFRSPQLHTGLNGNAEELFRTTSLADLRTIETTPVPPPPSLLPTPARGDYAWAMVIDTDACIGCNACVVACQAENNVPVVGPEEISQGRDMHWLRVDGYSSTRGHALRSGFQPVPCMHCELAPCEPVCPVEASVHDRQGLNVQVYNRCIGTRFCQANCPYKVRRFNWFAYAGAQAYAGEAAALRAQHNPDVSVRGRGVMEKCNYCLQRINRTRRTAERENRPVAEGEMVTACQAACPTRAIHFGDLNRADSEVSRLRRAPQHYTLLAELNTRPRTTYLQRIFNDGDAS